ncbi:MAG TPA: hypothetical protein VK390_11925 [Propionibacteriaceae bacterium]|nr:hypothetical protein [Propionibacteriaceae bacterium]
MSDHRRYQPPNDEVDEFCRRLRELMGSAVVAICAHAPELAVVIACRLDAGKWRLRTSTDLDDDGEPDPETLWFHVAVELDNDGWLPLCGAHWSTLGVSEESAREETRWTALQSGYGIPNDIAEITDSPS